MSRDNSYLVLAALGGIAALLWTRNANAATYSSSTMFATGEQTDETAPLDDAIYTNPFDDMPYTTMTNIRKLTRGERNNNPGNIVKSGAAWQGMSADQSGDTRFVTFSSPEYGIRALGKLLENYGNSGFNTVRKVINRWAPPIENNTSAYVNAVAQQIGVGVDEQLDMTDLDTLALLADAIITHENGRNIYADNGVMDAGIALLA